MLRGKSVMHRMDKISASSFRSISNDHKSLGADCKQAHEAQTTTLDTGLSSAMLSCRGGVPSSEIHSVGNT